MRWHKVVGALLLCGALAILMGAGCTCTGIVGGDDGGVGGGAGGGGGGGGGADGGGDDGGQDAGEPPDAGPFGYVTRPANPTCVAPARPTVQSGVTTQRAWPNLSFSQPLGLLQAPGDTARVFVVERPGRVRVFPNDMGAMSNQVTTFVDIASGVNTSGEGGLLGFAFHPNWQTNHEAFVSYTETGTGGNPLRTVVARYKSTDNGATLDPSSEERLFLVDQPYTNHDGGNIAFGPDGFLYIGLGDGGSGGDPLDSGQRLNTTLGKMLRIDVNVPAAQKYAIPASNPFATSGAACNLASSAATHPTIMQCAEIYAWGLRNPWRWSFDTATGDLWVGDVGQNLYEEVDLLQLGGNYGWNTREGTHCYGAATCNTSGLIDPVLDYDRSDGNSITGGFVYRGTTIPSLVGKFIYGDYGSGRIWAVDSDAMGNPVATLLQDTNIALASFGQTADGEVFALNIANGQVFQLVPQGTPMPDTIPQKLSLSGCFEAANPTQAVEGLIPYDLNAPLWSDGAAKDRFFAIPDGTTVTVGTDGDFDFPDGSVLAKTFWLDGKRVETRLLMKHPDGVWAGYSYEWLDDQSDALLLPAGKTKQVGTHTWSFPSRAQCLACHTAVSGRALGPEVAQLNRDLRYPRGVTRNQLTTLDGLGFLSAALPGPADTLPKLEAPSGTGPVEDRARAYLHANCSICHRSGAGQGPQDFRASLAFKDMNVCDVAPQNGDLGVTGARLFAPGSPATSIMSVRMHALDARRMPPLGSRVVDSDGTALIDAWITSVSACPP